MSRTSRLRPLALVALLGAAMVTSTYLQGALAVLSVFVISELGISRSQLGLAFAVFSLTGAATSPLIGGVADRGTRRVIVGLFAVGAAALLLAAGAPGYLVLLAASLIGGLALGAANPVTNRIISERVSPRRRGVVVGVKQAGPPLALLVAGVVLPPLAVGWGWRAALAVSALIPLAGLLATRALIPAGAGDGGSEGSTDSEAARRAVLWLTVLGFGVAVGVSATIAFLPLYAQEEVGMSATAAGLLAAAMGLAGVAGRIGWGALGGRFSRPSTGLLVISGISVLATVGVAGATTAGPTILWAGAIALGGTVMAWHALAWLVIIDRVGTVGLGRASGIMQAGSGIGFALGPPAAGTLVDLTGAYAPAWTMVGVVFGGVTALTLWVRIRTARETVAVPEGSGGS